MKIVVLQSTSRHHPHWISRCIESVEPWAARKGYEYRRMGDELFKLVPSKIRRLLRGVSVATLVDAGRLYWARSVLDEGAHAVVWIDHDCLIVDSRFRIPFDDAVFAREHWLARHSTGPAIWTRGISNCVCAFTSGSYFLNFYIWAINVVASRSKIDKLTLGPKLLTHLARKIPFTVLPNVVTLSPLALMRVASTTSRSNWHDTPVGRNDDMKVAHFCGSLAGRTIDGISLTESLFDRAITQLLALPRQLG